MITVSGQHPGSCAASCRDRSSPLGCRRLLLGGSDVGRSGALPQEEQRERYGESQQLRHDVQAGEDRNVYYGYAVYPLTLVALADGGG